MRSACFLLGFLFALPGCGGKSRTNQGELGNQAGTDNVGVAGSSGGHAGDAASGGAGAGGQPALCATFVDAQPRSIPVLIRNDLTFPIHLGSRTETCSEMPLFSVQDASGKALRGPGPCRSPCETFLAGDLVGGCIANCPISKAITLEPEESIAISWAGVFEVKANLPIECVPKRSDGLDFGTQCDYARSIESGTYTFAAQAGTSLDCSQFSPEGCNECEPDADGLCAVPNALVGGRVLNARSMAEIDIDGQNAAVTLVFEE